MGNLISCCSTNLFKELYESYGEEFAKLMVAEKTKRFISEEFASLMAQFGGVFREFESKANTTVEKGRSELQRVYFEIKNKINGTIPGGINALEKIKGENIDEFSGYNKLQGKVDAIKTQALSKIDGEKVKLQSSMGEKKDEMVAIAEERRPKIPIYEQLPDNLKGFLLKEAETKFASQIKQNQSQIVDEIGKQFNINNVQSLYNNINPQNPLQSIVGSALGIFSSSLGSGGLGSTASNLIQQGLSLFGK